MSSQAPFPAEQGTRGAFVRQVSHFRDWVRADGSTPYPVEAGRYHVYVSFACPWAHRILIVRKVLGLEDVIGIGIVDPIRDERGWAFREGDGHGPDPLGRFQFLAEAYLHTDADFSGRVTVPTLWDEQTQRVVNNESSEVLRMLDQEFRALASADAPVLYPEPLRDEIDALNETIYHTVNNGVYRSGFATTQEAYEEADVPLFATLAALDDRLATRRYLTGPAITEADWRLFTTLVRFDSVYAVHFKCTRRRLVDHPHLWAYARDLYQQPGVAETVNFDHICRHYYETHRTINPCGIVPVMPAADWTEPHGRESG